MSYLTVLWLAFWLAGFPAGLLPGWLASWLAGFLAVWPAGWLPSGLMWSSGRSSLVAGRSVNDFNCISARLNRKSRPIVQQFATRGLLLDSGHLVASFVSFSLECNISRQRIILNQSEANSQTEQNPQRIARSLAVRWSQKGHCSRSR